MEQRTPPFKASHHFGIKPFLKVTFPFWVKGIGFGLDFDVTNDRDFGCTDQLYGSARAIFQLDLPIEAAVVSVFRPEIFSEYPATPLIAVSPFCPPPQSLVYLVVDIAEDLLADHVPVEVGPAPNDGIELGNELPRRQVAMGFDEGTHFEQERFDTLFGRFYEQFAVVFPHILA